MRYVRAARDAGLRRAVVSSSANCREVLEAAGHRGPVRGADRRGRRRARAPEGKAGAGHVPRRARERSASTPREAAVFEDALAGVDAGRAGGFGFVVGVDRVGQADALREHGADIVVSDLAELLEHRDHAPRLRRRAVGGARDAARPRRARADRVGVRALQRPHRAARRTSTRASRTACPGTYLNSFYELRPLPYAEAGYGYPESGQTIVNVTNGKIIRLLVDDEPFDVRYGELLAPRARARPARRRAAPPRRVAVAGRRVGPRELDAAGLVRPARGRGDPVRGRAARRAAARRRPVGAGGERAGAAAARRTRGRPRCSSAPLRSEDVLRPWRARRARALAPSRSGLLMAAGMDHLVDGPDGTETRRPRAAATSAA